MFPTRFIGWIGSEKLPWTLNNRFQQKVGSRVSSLDLLSRLWLCKLGCWFKVKKMLCAVVGGYGAPPGSGGQDGCRIDVFLGPRARSWRANMYRLSRVAVSIPLATAVVISRATATLQQCGDSRPRAATHRRRLWSDLHGLQYESHDRCSRARSRRHASCRSWFAGIRCPEQEAERSYLVSFTNPRTAPASTSVLC